MAALDSCGTGLASDEVLRRRARHGPNRLPQSPRPSLLQRFLLQFHNVLIYVLLGSAAITLVTTLSKNCRSCETKNNVPL